MLNGPPHARMAAPSCANQGKRLVNDGRRPRPSWARPECPANTRGRRRSTPVAAANVGLGGERGGRPPGDHRRKPTTGTFLKPHCVAIIGASRDPSKRGNRAIQMLLDSKFAGRIVPINPKESEILSLPCYPDLASVAFDVDLALVCTPASSVPEVVRLCGEKGVKGALILAGGFGEASEAGAARQARVLDIARRHGVRLIGPNTNGMFDGHTGCNLVGWPGVYKGSLGVLSQSGNVALSFVAQSQHNGHAGFTTFIGVGNEGDIRFHEYLRFFGDDPNAPRRDGFMWRVSRTDAPFSTGGAWA
jgi:predicted CoA-binding protein